MAQLTITIPDAVVQRIKTAFGRTDPQNPTQWIDATVADVQGTIKAFVKGQVVNYETRIVADETRTQKSQESW